MFSNNPVLQKFKAYSEDSLSDQLVRFIRLNKVVSDFPLEIHKEEHQKNIADLTDAINKANAKDEIFDHPNCLLYLLALIKNQQLNNNQALTIITWLIAKQSKAYKNIEVIDINQNEELRSVFIKQMFYQGRLTDKDLNQAEVKLQIANFKGVDAWAFLIPSSSSSLDDFTFQVVCANTLYLSLDDPTLNGRRLIPSFATMQLLSKELGIDFNPYAMMGVIGEERLEELHTNGFCPLAVYAPFVKKNLDTIDATGRKYEPLTVFLHDLYHLWSFSLLSSNERNFIFHYALPLLDDLSKKLLDYNVDHTLIKSIDVLYSAMNDVDIAIPVKNNVPVKVDNKRSILHTWLRDVFVRNSSTFEKCKEPVSLFLFYYQLCLKLFEDENKIKEEYQISIPLFISHFQYYFIYQIANSLDFGGEVSFLIKENISFFTENNQTILNKIVSMNNSRNLDMSSFLKLIQSEIKASEIKERIDTHSTLFQLRGQSNDKEVGLTGRSVNRK